MALDKLPEPKLPTDAADAPKVGVEAKNDKTERTREQILRYDEQVAAPFGVRWTDRMAQTFDGWLSKKVVNTKLAIPTWFANMAGDRARDSEIQSNSLSQRLSILKAQGAGDSARIKALETRAGSALSRGKTFLDIQKLRGTERSRSAEIEKLTNQLEKAKAKNAQWMNTKSNLDVIRNKIAEPHLKELDRRREPLNQHAERLQELSSEVQKDITDFRARRDKAEQRYDAIFTELMANPSPALQARFDAIAPQLQIAMVHAETFLKDADDRQKRVHRQLRAATKATAPLNRFSKNINDRLASRTGKGSEKVDEIEQPEKRKYADRTTSYPFGEPRTGSAERSAPRSRPEISDRLGELLRLAELDDNDEITVATYVEEWNRTYPDATIDESFGDLAALPEKMTVAAFEGELFKQYDENPAFKDTMNADRTTDLSTRLNFMRVWMPLAAA